MHVSVFGWNDQIESLTKSGFSRIAECPLSARAPMANGAQFIGDNQGVGLHDFTDAALVFRLLRAQRQHRLRKTSTMRPIRFVSYASGR